MSRRLLVIALFLGSTAAAAEPPAYFALPDGTARKNVTYETYGFEELAYPDPAQPRTALHREVRGEHWRVEYDRKTPDERPAILAAALQARGWEILQSNPVLIGHYAQGGKEAWVKCSAPGSVAVVETRDARAIQLPPPGEKLEDLTEGKDLPYFPAFPGLKVQAWKRIDSGAGCAVKNPVLPEITYAGPPSVQIRYQGSVQEVTPVELQESYVSGLQRAGWDVLGTGRGNNTVAHFHQHGRDVWLAFAPGSGYLNVCAADLGAAAVESTLKKQLDEAGHIALYGIYFDLDKATLRPEAEVTLQKLRALLAGNPTLKLEIQGHTDSTGTHDHNQQLSDARAAAVRAWLSAHDIDAARLTSAGYAETKPVAPNDTPENRQKNRRVEIVRK